MTMYTCPYCGAPVIAMPGTILEFQQDYATEDWECINPDDAEFEEAFDLASLDQEQINEMCEDANTDAYCDADECGKCKLTDGTYINEHLRSIAPDGAYLWAWYTKMKDDNPVIKLKDGTVKELCYDAKWEKIPKEYSFSTSDLTTADLRAFNDWVDSLTFEGFDGKISQTLQQ